MVTSAFYAAAAALVLSVLGEWLHARRSRRIARLAFGPAGAARGWTRWVPATRVLTAGALAWGLAALCALAPAPRRASTVPEGGYRHLLIALDTSPSMQLKDAGAGRKLTRAQRAAELILSVLERAALEQMRVSIVAFYSSAKPVVVDTFDLAVVKNVLNDLPLDQAFNFGKTDLIQGIEESMKLAKPWEDGSTTLLIVSDGDTVPPTGMPTPPRSIAEVLVIGVGDPRTGQFIDGHQSRQDVPTLRQIANRLRGVYHDGNEKHIASAELRRLARILPLAESASSGMKRLILGCIGAGAALLAALPLALALGGSPWQTGGGSGDGRELTQR